MLDSSVENLLDLLNGSGSDAEFNAVKELQKYGDEFPKMLLTKYKNSKQWGHRSSCVYHSMKYSAHNEDSFQLGLLAIKDKSKNVRYRGCMLLALSQRDDALEPLNKLVTDTKSKDDALAAIDAIQSKNVNFFVDRHHSGKIKLNV